MRLDEGLSTRIETNLRNLPDEWMRLGGGQKVWAQVEGATRFPRDRVENRVYWQILDLLLSRFV